MKPAPRPVPKVRKITLSNPRPAPKRHSASAQAFASFCMRTGTHSRRARISVTGMLSHPGRLGGERTTPVLLLSGPPQLTPAASISPPKDRARSASVSSSASGEGKRAVSTCLRPTSSIFSDSYCAAQTAHFVPPISMPMYKKITSVKSYQAGRTAAFQNFRNSAHFFGF